MTATDFRVPQGRTDGRSEWEARQYAADHGMAAAAGQGLSALGAHICDHGARDALLLGLPRLPGPGPYLIAVVDGTEAERRAKVDAFARAHHVTAAPDEATGTYRAVVMFGPVPYIAYTRPEGDLARWADEAARRLAELQAGRRPAA